MASLMPPLSHSVRSASCISRLEDASKATVSGRGRCVHGRLSWSGRDFVGASNFVGDRNLVGGRRKGGRRRERHGEFGKVRAASRPSAFGDEEGGGGAVEGLLDSDMFEQVFQAPRKRVAPLVGKPGWRIERPGTLKKEVLIPEEWKPAQAERHKSSSVRKKEYIDALVQAAQEKQARKRALLYEQEDGVSHRTFLPQTGAPGVALSGEARDDDGGPDLRFPVQDSGGQVSDAGSGEEDFGFEDEDDDDDEAGSEKGGSRAGEFGDSQTSDAEDEGWSDAERGTPGRQGQERVVGSAKRPAATERAKPRDPYEVLGDRSFADVVKRVKEDEELKVESTEGRGPVQRRPGGVETGVELEAVKALFKKRPPNFLRTGSEAWMPLHTISASWEKNMNLQQLLRYDIDINELDKDGMTALHRAVCNGRRTTAKVLVEAGANAEVLDKDGAGLLHYAARAGTSDVARDLLKLRLDPNVADNDGWTPLHVAVQSGRKDVVKRFLTYGAQSDIQNKDGCTPVDLAVSFALALDFYDIVKLFPLSPEQQATLDQVSTPEERVLYQNRVKSFGMTTPEKWMLLHTLVASGNLFHACEILRQGGIDLGALDKDGHTALWKAVIYGKPVAAKHLVEAGANPFGTDARGATLLHYAAQNGFVDNIKKLTKKGVYVNSPDEDGWTPLHVAVQAGRKDVILCLLNHGADRHYRNKDGNRVLDIAASFGRRFGYYQVAKVISKAQYRKAEERFGRLEAQAATVLTE